MNQNIAKIRAGLLRMAHLPPPIVSGTVVAGSMNSTAHTCSVTTFYGDEITDVILSAVSGSSGAIMHPADGSHVIVGAINGPGQWMVLATSELDLCQINTGNTELKLSGSGGQLSKGNTKVKVDELVTIASASEDLCSIMLDLVNAIAAITVTTSAGSSSVPVNVASFTSLIARINNLLSS